MLLDDPKRLRAFYDSSLREDIIPFWLRHSPDRECGGYFTCLNLDGSVFDTDKFVWLQARQVWMFSRLFKVLEHRKKYLEMAALGAKFLAEHGRDPSGDWYFVLDRKGQPLVQACNIFSDCFAAMAFAEYGAVTGEKHAIDMARQTFERILMRQSNPKGKYNKAVTQTRPMLSLALPMIILNLVMEMRSALKDYPASRLVGEYVQLILRLFVDRREGKIFEHVAPDGGHPDTFEGRLINPGHGIECAWFLMQAAQMLGDDSLVETAADALEDQLAFGWDEKYGGIFYFLDARGKPPLQLEWDQKLWWVHNEALIALLMAWRFTRRPGLARWYQRVHEYAWNHFPDREHGEWFGYLNRRGEVLLPLKGGQWKGCFHVPRCMLLCRNILDDIIASKQKGGIA